MARTENPQAALELLILKTLSAGPNHGFGIALKIEESSSALLRVEEGSLYPALHRLEKAGFVEAEWQVTGNSRRAVCAISSRVCCFLRSRRPVGVAMQEDYRRQDFTATVFLW